MKRSFLIKTTVTATLLSSALIPITTYAQLEEIVVTATRRSADLQDVPISITALTADMLKKTGINEAITLSTQTPGLNMIVQGAALTPFIRGVGTLDGSSGQESSVALYVDGIYSPSLTASLFSFNNIERIEVLRGPQGTLFGRNATGGLIQIITKTPGQETEMKGSISYGNYDSLDAKLYASTGLTDNLAADIAISYKDQGDGFGQVVGTGGDVGTYKETLLRSKWVYTPSDLTTITASFGYQDSESARSVGTQMLPGQFSVDTVTTYNGNFQDAVGTIDPFIAVQGTSTGLQIKHDYNNFSLKSITGYQENTFQQEFDFDSTTLIPAVHVFVDDGTSETFSQEIQFLSGADSAFQWIAGAFYMKDESGYDGPLGLGIFSAFLGIPGVNGFGTKSIIETESLAAFGEATFSLNDRTDLTMGARYTRDKRTINGQQSFFDTISPEGRTALFSTPPVSQSETFNEPTYRAILDHHLNDNTMIYASYSHGFKSGNYNAISIGDLAFQPEILDTYEIGMKAEFFDNRLRLNASAFFNDFQDIQVGIVEGPIIVIRNAAKADIYGLEIDGSAIISESFQINFGLSILDSEYKEFTNATCFFPQAAGSLQSVCDASGNSLISAPEFTFNIAPVVTVPVSSGVITASLGYYYTDGFNWDPGAIYIEKSYDLLSASIGWTSVDEKIGVRLFGKNLTDSEYANYVSPRATGSGFAAAPPRTYGIEFSFSM